jgi:hypothetical protein
LGSDKHSEIWNFELAANTDFPGSLAAALLEISTTVSQIFTLKEPRLDTAKRPDLNKKPNF